MLVAAGASISSGFAAGAESLLSLWSLRLLLDFTAMRMRFWLGVQCAASCVFFEVGAQGVA